LPIFSACSIPRFSLPSSASRASCPRPGQIGRMVSRLCTGVLHSYCLLPRCLLLNLSLCLLVHLDLLHLNQANGGRSLAVQSLVEICIKIAPLVFPTRAGSATGGDRLTDDLRDVPRLSTAVAEFLIPRNKRMAGVGGDQTRLSVMTLMRAASGQGRSTSLADFTP
jgi:hypothetical protein